MNTPEPKPTADHEAAPSGPLEETVLTRDDMTSDEHALMLNTPKKAVMSFLTAWQFRLFQAMFTTTTRTWKAKHSIPSGAEWLAGAFGSFTDFEFGKIEEDPEPTPSPEVADFIVPVKYAYQGKTYETKRYIRVIREIAPYRPSAAPGSYWGVNPLSALRESK